MFELIATILGYDAKTFEGKDGKPVAWNSAVLRLSTGSIVRITSSVDLSKNVDKKVTLQCELAVGKNMASRVKILSVKA